MKRQTLGVAWAVKVGDHWLNEYGGSSVVQFRERRWLFLFKETAQKEVNRWRGLGRHKVRLVRVTFVARKAVGK